MPGFPAVRPGSGYLWLLTGGSCTGTHTGEYWLSNRGRFCTGTHRDAQTGTRTFTNRPTPSESRRLKNFHSVVQVWDTSSWHLAGQPDSERDPQMPAEKITHRSLRRSRFQKTVKRTAAEQEVRNRLALAFHDAAVYRGYCAVCHVRPEHLHAHHCVEAAFLRRELKNVVDPLRLDAILYDTRNALGVCDADHLNDHWSGRRRIFRHHLPESAFEFARELDKLTGTEKFTVRLEQYPEAS